MSENIYNEMDDDLRPEYDLSELKGGVRGKYAERYNEGTNLILLDPDVAEVFKDNDSVNQALRLLIKTAKPKIKNAGAPFAPADSPPSSALEGANR